MSDQNTPKVTITPTEQVIKQAGAETTITDAKGRVIVLRKPGVLAQFKIVEAAGTAAANQVWMGMVMPLIYVASVDGEAVYCPTTRREIDALIQRLDEDGIIAVMQEVQALFGVADTESAKADLKK